MSIETVREYCLNKKATTKNTPSGEGILVIRVMGRMFLCISLNTPDYITVKRDPEYALGLREYYNAIEETWHLSKKCWNQVLLDGDADDRLIKHLVGHSCEEVIRKFAKEIRNEYGALP